MQNQIQIPVYNGMDQNQYYGQFYTQSYYPEQNYFNNGDIFGQNYYNHVGYDYQNMNFASTIDNAKQLVTYLYNLQNLSKEFFGEHSSNDSKSNSELSKNSSRNNVIRRIKKVRKTLPLYASDWKCANCQYFNFSKRKVCKKCLSKKNSQPSPLNQVPQTLQ